MRERLIELMHEGDLASGTVCDDCDLEFIANYLLDNGVIVLPCKVGTPVYEVLELYFVGDTGGEYFCTIIEHKFELRMLDEIGRTVFPTKEEAEAKLAELKGTEE